MLQWKGVEVDVNARWLREWDYSAIGRSRLEGWGSGATIHK